MNKKEKSVRAYSPGELSALLDESRRVATAVVEFKTPLVGGVPAKDKDVRAFVEHHLGIPPDHQEFEMAVKRILNEEVEDATPPAGEVKIEEVYSYTVIRANEIGPYITEHMVKAAMKQAASRLNLFVSKRGSKGDMAEMTAIRATGPSARSDRPWELYLVGADGNPAEIFVEVIKGCPSTPSGKRSIMGHHQAAPVGTRCHFEIWWPDKKITETDMALVMAGVQQISIGSALAMGFGKISVGLEIA